MKQNRCYPAQFRAEATKMVIKQGLSQTEVATRLGIPEESLASWVAKATGPDELFSGDDTKSSFNDTGELIVHKAGRTPRVTAERSRADRFEAVRGTAQIKWHTDELMALLRRTD